MITPTSRCPELKFKEGVVQVEVLFDSATHKATHLVFSIRDSTGEGHAFPFEGMGPHEHLVMSQFRDQRAVYLVIDPVKILDDIPETSLHDPVMFYSYAVKRLTECHGAVSLEPAEDHDRYRFVFTLFGSVYRTTLVANHEIADFIS